MTGLIAAIRYLTIVPLPGPAHAPGSPGAAAAWFPVVGLLLGATVMAVDRAATTVFAAGLAAGISVAVWKTLTGGLHLDGLADTLDGLMGRDAAHRLEIMRDSRLGSFGAIGLILVLVLAIGAVSALDARTRAGALVLAPVAGRAMSPLIARLFPAPGGGHGAGFRAGVPLAAVPLALAMATVVAVITLGGRGLLAVALVALVAIAVAAFMSRRLGGVTGDVHGASVELGELTVLLVAAAAYPGR